jgi:dipeptidyl aminopeptidase/acylaminoacyl peptidase
MTLHQEPTMTRATALIVMGLAAAAAGPWTAPVAGQFGASPAGRPDPSASLAVASILSAPFPSGLVASPSGDRVAWVRNDRGVRDIWVAEGPEWRARRVTDHDRDTGHDLSGLELLPDGRHLLYTVGGSPNRAGERPNPASLPDGPESGLFRLDLGTGETVALPGGPSRAVSPDGSTIAFVQGGAVQVAAIEPGTEARPLFQARGALRSLAWSPDGTRLAFVSARGGHAFVGVYDTAAHGITWLDPSVDRDGDPVWSPAGDRVAFLRVPPRPDALPFFAQPESIPWSIMVADPVTGEARTVWRADDGPGSAFRGVTGPNLIWTTGDRLVFPWEKEGWTHLWSVPAAGGDAVLLTPGAFEVYHVAPAAGGREILYSSNQDDIDRMHLWRVPADGSARPNPLTTGDGIEWLPVEPAPGVLAFLASGATTPARAEILLGGRRHVLAPDAPPASFPADRLVVPEQVVFPAEDGLRIHGQLFRPPTDCGPGPHPGLLFLHGGSRRQMLLGFHHGLYYHHAYAFNQYMAAARCWMVLSVNFRSGIGYGLEFREAADYGAGGASELRDVTAAARWLGARDDVDASRVALWGGSYGGYLTALGLARAPELFAAGVDVHGVHDWNVTIRNFVPSYEPAARPDVARSALEASPLYDLSQWRAPILLVHGDDDRNVPFSETVTLAEALRLRGVTVETLVFPDEVHSFLLWENWVRTFEEAATFLTRHIP